ncbi:MAG: response regulator [Lachnospiraceae bacterium]|nr:response regulator [Lachnospiraceae bacterium]
MLPYSTNIVLCVIEFFSMVLLYVAYAFSQYGIEKALFISIGFLPALLTILLYRFVRNEKLVIRIFYLTMVITSYVISWQLGMLGSLAIIFFAGALMMALYANRGLMIEYAVITVVALLLNAIFLKDSIQITTPIEIYLIYMLIYVFAMVSFVFLVNGVLDYKARMEEKNEEANNALEAKANFLANMSHEIRTPMNAIYGMAELLDQKDFAEEEKGYIDTIRKSSENLLAIINEILDFSKIDSGKMEITKEEYHFNSLIHDVLSIIEFRMKNRSVKLIYDIAPDIPRVLIGDELRIRQILINLLNNAVNFTHRGHIALRIFWEPDLDGNGYMHVSVEDTGIGISQADMNKLFTAFGQIDTKKNRNVEGTGLGLVITKRLLNLMGGDITVRSKVNEGSTFSFVLHQIVKDPRPSNYNSNHEKVTVENAGYKITFKAPTARVMIVDDNKVNLTVASELMKRFGFEAVMVESGMEAYNRIEEHLVEYDLVFMDHMMPVMDGVEATRKIRALPTQYAKKLPIVALTANAIKGVERQFKEAGMNDYLAKPIHMNQLGEILKRWIPLEKQVHIVNGQEIQPTLSVPADTGSLPMPDSTEIIDLLKGIDVEDGLRNCGGSKSVYLKVLTTFASSNLLASLQEYFIKGDLENYTVMAHSIRGACRNIGANDVADQAYELECAGRDEDVEFINKYHKTFCENYSEVLRIVTKALVEQNAGGTIR